MNAPKIQNLVEVSKCHVAHLMACKARKIAVAITETKTLKNNCLADETFFIAYGEDDITTIPYQFGPGKYFHDTSMQFQFFNADNSEMKCVHINAALIALLCYLRQDSSIFLVMSYETSNYLIMLTGMSNFRASVLT